MKDFVSNFDWNLSAVLIIFEKKTRMENEHINMSWCLLARVKTKVREKDALNVILHHKAPNSMIK